MRENDEVFRCKCRDKSKCPLPGRCTTDKVVYRATVSSGTSVETYVGLTAGEFKDRFYKNYREFRDPGQQNSLHLETEGRTEDLQY